jgi:predicted DCC family thiol-disulfide oxidoreductase YuxK
MDIPALTIYFDGACAFCRTEVAALRGRDRHGALAFIDIAAPGFAAFPAGTDMAALQAQLHSVTRDGEVLRGLDSMQAAYALVGLGWVVLPLRIRALRPPLEWAYGQFARHRYRISRLLGLAPRTPPVQCDDNVCRPGSPWVKERPDER